MVTRLVHLKKSFGKNATALETHPARLLIVAAILHLVVTTVIFVIGRLQLMPGQFDRNGIGEFAHDGRMHQMDAILLTSKLQSEGVRSWLSTDQLLVIPATFLISFWFLQREFWRRLEGTNFRRVRVDCRLGPHD